MPRETVRGPHTSSKYDFVKVRVWLGENSDHYYVLSRFLVSRMLTVTKIPSHVAIKIALELKKLMVDNSLLDVSQADLEANLFKLMQRRGYGEDYISRYKMMTRFHHLRVPLVILVAGSACVGKSTIATQLAQRLNLPNVLQTDLVYELLRTAPDNPAPLNSTPLWGRNDLADSEELLQEYRRECRVIRKGLHGDLAKSMRDGKPIIIEGLHLDPGLYLRELCTQAEPDEPAPLGAPPKDHASIGDYRDGKTLVDSNADRLSEGPRTSHSNHSTKDTVTSKNENGHTREESSQRCGLALLLDNTKSSQRPRPAISQKGEANGCLEQTVGQPSTSGTIRGPGRSWGLASRQITPVGSSMALSKAESGFEKRDAETESEAAKAKARKEQAIVVPIVLKMQPEDHQSLLQAWLACRASELEDSKGVDQQSLLQRFQAIQDYLCSYEAQGVAVVNVSPSTVPQTLDWLHSFLLECIEKGSPRP